MIPPRSPQALHPHEADNDPHAEARVVVIAACLLDATQWTRRGMHLIRVAQAELDRLLAQAPDAIVVEPTAVDAQQVVDCWQAGDVLQIPLLVLSQGASGEEVAGLFDRGAADVVTERPECSLLAARVAAILRRLPAAGACTPGMLQMSGGAVDLARRLVLRPDGSRSLSRTEFRLLQALLHAGGRACSHGELITRVWGVECASATHYLRLYIRYLRQKLERDPKRPRNILNVRGNGYRLTLGSVEQAAACDERVGAVEPLLQAVVV